MIDYPPCPLENEVAMDPPSLFKTFPEAEHVWICMSCGKEADRVEEPMWSRRMWSKCCHAMCYRGD